MQNYGKRRPSLHTIRTLASGCHGDEVVWEINHIPSLLSKQFNDVFFASFPTRKQKTDLLNTRYVQNDPLKLLSKT